MSKMLDYKIALTGAWKAAGQNWPKPGCNAHLIEKALENVLEHMDPAELARQIAPADTIRAPRKLSHAVSGNYADQVKAAVSVKDVAQTYGITLNRQGYALCPFHREKTASFMVYPHGRGWYCFGCGEGGDVIRLVQKLFDLSFLDAIRKLDEDFHLGLEINRPRTPLQQAAENQNALRQLQHKKLVDEAISKASAEYEEALSKWTALDTIRRFLAPARPEILDDAALAELDFDPFWAAALMLLPEAENALEEAEARLYSLTHTRD